MVPTSVVVVHGSLFFHTKQPTDIKGWVYTYIYTYGTGVWVPLIFDFFCVCGKPGTITKFGYNKIKITAQEWAPPPPSLLAVYMEKGCSKKSVPNLLLLLLLLSGVGFCLGDRNGSLSSWTTNPFELKRDLVFFQTFSNIH